MSSNDTSVWYDNHTPMKLWQYCSPVIIVVGAVGMYKHIWHYAIHLCRKESQCNIPKGHSLDMVHKRAWIRSIASSTHGPELAFECRSKAIRLNSIYIHNTTFYMSTLYHGILHFFYLGNVLSLLTMSRASFKHTTTSLYVRVLAVVDTLCLFIGLLRQWILWVLYFCWIVFCFFCISLYQNDS